MNKLMISVVTSSRAAVSRKNLGLRSTRHLGPEVFDDGKRRLSTVSLQSVFLACKTPEVFLSIFPSMERYVKGDMYETCDVISVTRLKRPYRDWDASPDGDDVVPSPVIKYVDDIDTPIDAEKISGIDVRSYERLVIDMSSSEYVYVGWVSYREPKARYALLISDPTVVLASLP